MSKKLEVGAKAYVVSPAFWKPEDGISNSYTETEIEKNRKKNCFCKK